MKRIGSFLSRTKPTTIKTTDPGHEPSEKTANVRVGNALSRPIYSSTVFGSAVSLHPVERVADHGHPADTPRASRIRKNIFPAHQSYGCSKHTGSHKRRSRTLLRCTGMTGERAPEIFHPNGLAFCNTGGTAGERFYTPPSRHSKLLFLRRRLVGGVRRPTLR